MKEILKEIENIEKVADLKTKVLLQMLKAKVIKMIVEEETLIQEERKEAVRGLIEYLEANTEKVFYLGCGRIATEYLEIVESEGKE